MLRRGNKITKSHDTNKEESQRKHAKKIKNAVPLGADERICDGKRTLEHLVLGGETELLDSIDKFTNKSKRKKRLVSSIKPAAAWQDDDDETDVVVVEKEKERKIPAKRYKQQLKNKFEDVSGTHSWAKLRWEKSDSGASDNDEDSQALLQTTGNYLRTGEALTKECIQLKKCTDANRAAPAKGKVHAVEFHPTAQVLMTGSSDHTLRLFQVDGKTNPLIQSIFVDRFPILGAHFNAAGTEVIMSSLHRSFYTFDMMAGKIIQVPRIKGLEESTMQHFVMSPDGQLITFMGRYGHIHLISAKSKEWIGTMKMNGSVEAIAYTPDGSKMLSHGDDGQVYVWDMKTRDCIHRFYDDGAVRGTSLAVSPNGQYIASGSYSGVVNLYDESCLTKTTPSPLKAIMNQTSPCTSLKFNSTSEILATASNYANNMLKLVHMQSMTVFSNFPDRTDQLFIPLSMDFSVNSGYFAMGNQKGMAPLYRVKHYANY